MARPRKSRVLVWTTRLLLYMSQKLHQVARLQASGSAASSREAAIRAAGRATPSNCL